MKSGIITFLNNVVVSVILRIDYDIYLYERGQRLRSRGMEINNIASSKPIAAPSSSSVATNVKATSTPTQPVARVDKVEGRTESGDLINLYQPQSGKLEEDQIIRTIEKANKRLVGANKEMRMSVHEETKKINIKIIDKETDEVIVEYPPEKLLDIFAKMVELSGLVVDERR